MAQTPMSLAGVSNHIGLCLAALQRFNGVSRRLRGPRAQDAETKRRGRGARARKMVANLLDHEGGIPASSVPEAAAFRILTFTTLFPNPAQPAHGVFVENRLRHLVASGRVSARVIAPVPWFPSALSRWFRGHAHLARIPQAEWAAAIPVLHPRYPVLPKIGMAIAPLLLFFWTLAAMRRLRRTTGEFDLIDAHYLYPDGVAAVMAGKVIGKPVVITARGTDVNLIPRYALPRWFILFAARGAAGIIAVSQALKDELVALGVAPSKIRVLRNGVDLDMFRPKDRAMARDALGVNGPTLISVGLLIDRKGHNLVIEALTQLPTHTLIIVGDGPERKALERLATKLKVDNRVRFLGRVAHQGLADIYVAADALVLASSREGWPNVLLEAMACGTPVVASNVWGNPEVVAAPEAGVLMSERSVKGVVDGVRALFNALPRREDTRRYAEMFSWDATTRGQIELFSEIIRKTGRTVA
jgi:teichuronic acid biosynthesis glycosyltransferase TuaC